MKDKSFLESRLSKEAHYFGFGTIAEVQRDINNNKNCLAKIISYQEFDSPVPIKTLDNVYFENVKTKNHFRNGVREINADVYNNLKALGGIVTDEAGVPINLHLIEDVQLTLSNEDLINFITAKKRGTFTQKQSNKASKIIGDFGEALVVKYLKSILSDSEFDSSNNHDLQFDFCGYDLSYISDNGQKICVEVKSTTQKNFSSFIITENEFQALEKERDNYKIFLVAECGTKHPKLQIFDDLLQKLDSKEFEKNAIAFKISKSL